MEQPYQIPNILHLCKLTHDEWKQMDDEQLAVPLDVTEIYDINEANYGVILHCFTGAEDWPNTTGLKCWFCCLNFDVFPKFIPTYIKETERDQYEIGVMGNFCSFGCAAGYVRHVAKTPADFEIYMSRLCHLHWIFMGEYIHIIEPPQPTHVMKEYGGTMNREQYIQSLIRETKPIDRKHIDKHAEELTRQQILNALDGPVWGDDTRCPQELSIIHCEKSELA